MKRFIHSYKKIALFLIIFLIAFLLRAQETVFNNYLFLMDMGRDMMAVKGIVFDHHLTLIGPYTSLAGVFQGPFWYYLLAIPTFLTGGDPWGAVALMLVISMTTAVLAFVWMQKLFGFRAAIVTFLLIAIAPEAIAAATYSWNPHPMWLFITLYIFVLYTIRAGRQKYHLLLWPIITLMFHFETALGVFLFVATLLYFLIFRLKESIKRYIIAGIALSCIFFIPQIAFDIRHDFLMTRSVIALARGEDRGLQTTGEGKQRKLLNIHPDAYITNFRSGFVHSGYFILFPQVIAVLAIILFATRQKEFTQQEKLFITLNMQIVGIVLLLTLFYPFPFRYWFLTGFQMFYLLPIGLIVSKLLHFHLGKVLFALFILLLAPHVYNRILYLYVINPHDNSFSKIKGIKSGLDYVYTDAKGKNFGLLIFAPSVYTYNYDYTLWWYGKKKYNYVPHQEKKGTFYLLMEPDPYKPTSYNGWMKTVVKSGKTIKQEKLPSGLIVEKREAE